MAKIALLAGDGVGPEVTAEALKVLERVGAQHGLALEVEANVSAGLACWRRLLCLAQYAV